MKICRIFLLLLFVMLVSCKPRVPKQVIQPDKMAAILTDYHISQSMAQQDNASSDDRNFNRARNLSLVLEKHGVNRVDFDSSLVYYYKRADYFRKIYDRVTDRLGEQAIALGASQTEVEGYSKINEYGDTTNVWSGISHALLTPYAPYNRLDFTIDCDTSYYKGDSFMFAYQVDFVFQSGSKNALSCLAVSYENDSTTQQITHVSSSGNGQIRIMPLNGQRPKTIRGFIYLGQDNEKDQVLKLMFIRNIALIRFHQHETTSSPVKSQDVDLFKDTLKANHIGDNRGVSISRDL